MCTDPNVAFTLRIRLCHGDSRLVVIRAWDNAGWDSAGRIKLNVEVRHGGKVIFPKGQLHCALHGTSDGTAARELVMSLVAMQPGDAEEDYFADYTPDQLDWVTRYGGALGCERESRYCDVEGNPRKDGH